MSRLVRWQLVLFCLVTVVSIVVMAVWFMRVPDKAGLGRYQVAVDLTESGGLYATSNVTFLGQTVGRVKRVEVTPRAPARTSTSTPACACPPTVVPRCTAAARSASSSST